MSSKSLKVRKKGYNCWMKGFVISPPLSDIDKVEKERLLTFADRKVKKTQQQRNR